MIEVPQFAGTPVGRVAPKRLGNLPESLGVSGGASRPGIPACPGQTSRDQDLADLGPLDTPERVEQLGRVRFADVQGGIPGHLGERGIAAGDDRTAAGQGFRDRESEPFIPRRINQGNRTRICRTQLVVAQTPHRDTKFTRRRSTCFFQFRVAAGTNDLEALSFRRPRQRPEQQSGVLVAVHADALADGQEVWAGDAKLTTEAVGFFRPRRRKRGRHAGRADPHRAAGDARKKARQVAGRVFRDADEGGSVANAQVLFPPHGLASIAPEHLGNEVVGDEDRRRRRRRGVVRRDEKVRSKPITNFLEVQCVAAGAVVIVSQHRDGANAGDARSGAVAVQEDHMRGKTAGRPFLKERPPQAGDAGIRDLEENAVEDDSRERHFPAPSSVFALSAGATS